MTKPKYAKFRDLSDARLYECHLYIISVTKTRTGLIEAYRAARQSIGPGLLLAQLVTAIRERQQEILNIDMIGVTNGK